MSEVEHRSTNRGTISWNPSLDFMLDGISILVDQSSKGDLWFKPSKGAKARAGRLQVPAFKTSAKLYAIKHTSTQNCIKLCLIVPLTSSRCLFASPLTKGPMEALKYHCLQINRLIEAGFMHHAISCLKAVSASQSMANRAAATVSGLGSWLTCQI